MDELSPRQQAILEFIHDYTQANGYPPSIREIGKKCVISSTSVVNYNLNILKEKHYLERQEDISRGIRLVGQWPEEAASVAPPPPQPQESLSPGVFGIPLAGVIVAGEPIPVPDTSALASEMIALTKDIVPREETLEGLYALRVKGDSMIDALINDGDLVVVRPIAAEIVHDGSSLVANGIKQGEMIAAWLRKEQETTLKHFYLDRGQRRVRLQPDNPSYEPIYVDPANLQIQGKVVAVIRQV
jgi:repressor LexA